MGIVTSEGQNDERPQAQARREGDRLIKGLLKSLIILIAFVLLVPKGLVPTLGDFGQWLLRARTRRVATSLEPKQAEEG